MSHSVAHFFPSFWRKVEAPLMAGVPTHLHVFLWHMKIHILSRKGLWELYWHVFNISLAWDKETCLCLLQLCCHYTDKTKTAFCCLRSLSVYPKSSWLQRNDSNFSNAVCRWEQEKVSWLLQLCHHSVSPLGDIALLSCDACGHHNCTVQVDLCAAQSCPHTESILFVSYCSLPFSWIGWR